MDVVCLIPETGAPPKDAGVHAELAEGAPCGLQHGEAAYRASPLANKELHVGALELWSRLNPHAGAELRPELKMEDEGLGRPPANLKTTSALLLFNSSEIPHGGPGLESSAVAATGVAATPRPGRG